MARLPPLDRTRSGMPDALLQTMAASPEAARTALAHARTVMGGAELALTKALCAAMVAGLNFCRPSLVAHRRRARRAGADAAMLNDLWDYARSERFTKAQKAALATAVAMTREARGLPDAVWTALREHYEDAQIVELLCAIGLANYFDRVSNALQTGVSASD